MRFFSDKINKNKKFAQIFFLGIFLSFSIFLFSFLFSKTVFATDLTSTNFIIRDPVIGTGGGYGTSTNFKAFSAGQTLLSGVGSSATFIGHYGFLYYPFLETGILTAVANGADGDLTWTASVAAQGWTVDGYNVGIATVPGGPYTYTDVGNVLLYAYDNLAPGDYCFVVQTYDVFSYVIGTSNEDCITIAPVLVFDIDAGVADGETSTPYSVALGTIGTADVESSGTTDSINMIILEGETNATSGVVITVRNANGANGLKSVSVPGDDIASADGAMSAGTENYGLCVITAGLTGFVRASPYNSGSCATNSNTNDIQGLTSTGENILNSSSSPMPVGHAEISVNGAVSGTTPAHSDYSDTLTFIATSTF